MHVYFSLHKLTENQGILMTNYALVNHLGNIIQGFVPHSVQYIGPANTIETY